MQVGDLVIIKTIAYRFNQIGVIIKLHSAEKHYLGLTYSVLFWDEQIDRISGVCMEVIT
jgi:hypothetical protein